MRNIFGKNLMILLHISLESKDAVKFCKWQQVSFIALCVGEKINTSIDELVLKLTGKNKYSYFNTSSSITGILVLKQRLFYCVS